MCALDEYWDSNESIVRSSVNSNSYRVGSANACTNAGDCSERERLSENAVDEKMRSRIKKSHDK